MKFRHMQGLWSLTSSSCQAERLDEEIVEMRRQEEEECLWALWTSGLKQILRCSFHGLLVWLLRMALCKGSGGIKAHQVGGYGRNA